MALNAGPGLSRLEFRYSALSFTGPEKVRFRTQLEGLDDDWHDSGSQRVIAYEAVPPGHYRFRVIAANGDGVWNEAGATIAVVVTPQLWEETWFQIAAAVCAGALAIAIGGLIARARLRGRMLLLKAQTSRQEERARIAQDLHDDLGASLTEISLLANLATEEKNREHDPLPEIAAKARGLLGTLDEIVWAANPRHDSLASLAEYLAAFATEFLAAAQITLRRDIPNDLPLLPLEPEQRHGIFLAVREALNNVAKHSGASEAWLRFSIDAGSLKITVADNGRGFSTETCERGEGLRNMDARMAGIGGACSLASSTSGTRIVFTLPLAGK